MIQGAATGRQTAPHDGAGATTAVRRSSVTLAGPSLFLAMFAANAGLFVLPPTIPRLAAELSVSVATVGQLRAVAALVAVLTTFAVPALARRWDLRGLLAAGLVLQATGSLSAALAVNLTMLAAAHVVLGIGIAVVLPACLAATATWAPAGARGRMLSWALSGPGAAAIVVTLVAGMLAEHSWRAAWLTMPFATSLLALVAVRAQPEGAALVRARRGEGPAWRLSGVRGWVVGELLAYSAWSMVVIYSVALLVQSYGTAPSTAAVAVAASAAAFVLGTVLARNRLAASRPMLLATALIMAVSGGVFGMIRPSFGFSAAVLVLLGLINGGRVIAAGARGLAITPARGVEAMALRTTAQQVGYLVGAGLGGAVIAVVGYSGLGVLIAILMLLAALPHRAAIRHPRVCTAVSMQSVPGDVPMPTACRGTEHAVRAHMTGRHPMKRREIPMVATIDKPVLEEFLGRALSDAAAAVSVLLTHLGDRLGLYAAMDDSRPVTPAELARRTKTNERLAREWLSNQAAGGYVDYDAETGTFRLPPERAFALADESSPALVQGLFDLVAAAYQSIDAELTVFRTGEGLAWRDHHPALFSATERCFRPGYQAHLVSEWIPALEGLHDKLVAGARVADVGCGHGTATIVLATAYPNSTFLGYDYHAPSVETARKAAARAGVADRVRFEVADATTITGPFDLIAFFDSWHDTANPLETARAARAALATDGSVLLVEPLAGERLEDNLNPLGRFSYGISTVACTPCSVSDGGPGLGAQAGESRTRELFTDAGFTRFRRATETPLNAVYEARP